jgi:SAM-dependent methyltransferase
MSNNQKFVDALSTDKILLSAANMVDKKHKKFPAKHLDIGSGSGGLIKLLRSRFSIVSSACDYTDKLMKEKDVEVGIVNLNSNKLPYPDNTFDVVTCTEVLEHLEHYRETLQEAFRILKPGGTLVVTTPNILNLKSRLRFLCFGFFNLFGPLHFNESELHSTGGHITPISLFYLNHSLVDAGFSDISVAIDKKQGTSLFWSLFLYFPIKLFGWLALRKEIKKYKTVDDHNLKYVLQINSLQILTGRTIVVGCKKR